jgi:hypothetical protein
MSISVASLIDGDGAVVTVVTAVVVVSVTVPELTDDSFSSF